MLKWQSISPDLYPQSFSFLPKAYASTSFTIFGTVTAEDLPLSPSNDDSLHGIEVCVLEWDFNRSNLRELKCESTSSTGKYRISGLFVPSGTDGTMDVIMRYSTEGRQYIVAEKTDASGKVIEDFGYNVRDVMLRDISQTKNIDKEIETDNNDDEKYENAFWIADAISDSIEVIDKKFGQNMGKVSVAYQFDQGSRVFDPTRTDSNGNRIDGAYYCPDSTFGCAQSAQVNTIYLDHDDAEERWTVIHEYGHHVMSDLHGTGNYPPACSHTFTTFLTESCAWGEGFGDVLPHIVDESASYHRSSSVEILIEEDIRKVSGIPIPFITTDGNNNHGENSELQVAATIWDMFDDNDHSTKDKRNGHELDGIELSEKTFAKILDDDAPQTFNEFYDEWSPSSQLDNVSYLHHMSFATAPNSAPTTTDDSITLLQDTNTSFWLRGTDSSGDVLSFTITDNVDNGTLEEAIGTFDQSQLYKYTPDNGFSGTDSFKYKANDGQLDSNESTVTITVTKADLISFF